MGHEGAGIRLVGRQTSGVMTIRTARIRFLEGGVPFSDEFGDVYFSPEGGLAETEHVFLRGNDLLRRWQAPGRFAIGELGFGTGLNFLTTLLHWTRSPSFLGGGWLHFHSCELFPLSRQDHARALVFWPELEALSRLLVLRHPLPVRGLHVVDFPEFRATLHLHIGPVEEFLDEATFVADAWFLDGFAPSKNAAMWQESVVMGVAARSRPGTTAATFSVAGPVKRGLQAAGFDISKSKGFGRKRQMLTAKYGRLAAPPAQVPFSKSPSVFIPPVSRVRSGEGIAPRIAVIGAGMAGAWISFELCARGCQVDLFEKNPEPALEASGNPAGIFMPYLSAGESEPSEFALLSLGYLNGLLDRLEKMPGFRGEKSGVAEVLVSDEDQRRYLRALERLGLDAQFSEPLFSEQVSERTGFSIARPLALHAVGGWISPRDLVAGLIHQAGASLRCHLSVNVTEVEKCDSSWLVNGVVFDGVVLAHSNACSRVPQARYLPLTPLRGQITEFPVSGLTGDRLSMPIVAQEYLCPTGTDSAVLGATFDLKDDSVVLDPDKNHGILHRLKIDLGEDFIRSEAGFDPSLGRVAFRCTTADKLPVVGVVPDESFYLREYPKFFRGRAKGGDLPVTPVVHEGLYVLTGFGSRGITYIPLAARALAAEMMGEPDVLGRPMRERLHPARFLVRALRKGGFSG